MHKEKKKKKPYESVYHQGLQDGGEKSQCQVPGLILFREIPGSLCIHEKQTNKQPSCVTLPGSKTPTVGKDRNISRYSGQA